MPRPQRQSSNNRGRRRRRKVPHPRVDGYRLVQFSVTEVPTRLDATLLTTPTPVEFSRRVKHHSFVTAAYQSMFHVIQKGGLAYRLGIKPGDILVVASDDEKGWTFGTLPELIAHLRKSEPFALSVLRQDSRCGATTTTETAVHQEKTLRETDNDNDNSDTGRNKRQKVVSGTLPVNEIPRTTTTRGQKALKETTSVGVEEASKPPSSVPPSTPTPKRTTRNKQSPITPDLVQGKVNESVRDANDNNNEVDDDNDDVPPKLMSNTTTPLDNDTCHNDEAALVSQDPEKSVLDMNTIGDGNNTTVDRKTTSTTTTAVDREDNETTINEMCLNEVVACLVKYQVVEQQQQQIIELLVRLCVLLENGHGAAQFVHDGGLSHVMALLHQTSSNKIHGLIWKVVNLSQRSVNCIESLHAMKVHTLLKESLEVCQTMELFQTIICTLLSPALGYYSSICDFFSTPGVIAAFLKAMEADAPIPADYMAEALRLLNRFLFHPLARGAIREHDGLSRIAVILDRWKNDNNEAVQKTGREVIINLLT